MALATHSDTAARSEPAVAPKQQLQSFCNVLGPSVFLQVLNTTLLASARPQLVARRIGSVPDAAAALSLLESCGALLELVLNPLSGRASDMYGRRPFLPLAAFVSTLMRLLVSVSGSLPALSLDKLVTTAFDSVYFTVWRAALADLTARSGDSVGFATHIAKIGTCAGVAQVIGPMVGDLVRRRHGEHACFAAAGVVSLVNSAWLLCKFTETLGVEERRCAKTGGLKDSNPFSFIQCFAQSPQLARLFTAIGLQSLTEGRSIGNVNYLLLKNDYKWSETMIARFFSGLGIVAIVGGLLVKRSMCSFGLRGHTTMANLVGALVGVLWGGAGQIESRTGISTHLTMSAVLVLLVPATRKRDGLEALVMNLGGHTGLGRGFLSGALMNWRALFNITMPLLLGYTYAWGKRKGRKAPYAPFYLAAAALLLAEACVRSLTNKNLYLDDSGAPVERTG